MWALSYNVEDKTPQARESSIHPRAAWNVALQRANLWRSRCEPAIGGYEISMSAYWLLWRAKCQHDTRTTHGHKALESFRNNIKRQRPEHSTNAAI